MPAGGAQAPEEIIPGSFRIDVKRLRVVLAGKADDVFGGEQQRADDGSVAGRGEFRQLHGETSAAARARIMTGFSPRITSSPRWFSTSCRKVTMPMPGRERKARSEEHTSELQSLMRTSYAVFCLKKK